jgi:adenosylmethionine-8-amino-7-oxononanoate aminotransferase
MDATWAARAPALRRRMRDLGLLVRPLGPVVYLMPPLNTPEADLAFALERFEQGLRELG